MDKQTLYTVLKQFNVSRLKKQSIANHTQEIFKKKDHVIVVDSSPYSENVWDITLMSGCSVLGNIRSFEELKRCLENIS